MVYGRMGSQAVVIDVPHGSATFPAKKNFSSKCVVVVGGEDGGPGRFIFYWEGEYRPNAGLTSTSFVVYFRLFMK